MGPCTASSCCCQVQSVSWVPVRPPIAADFIARLCHRVLYGLPLLLPPPPPCAMCLCRLLTLLTASAPPLCHWTLDSQRLSRVQWQSGGAEAASIEGHTQA
ncbi:unnamed protein product [Staurois parvus]|uniref:Uncharacterized protein n=1 Tax=Staurois parvus TaxID=386267 RepID=A0ABN9BH58_9NEOB|nr:unnamed protein product [Staurois parvus]